MKISKILRDCADNYLWDGTEFNSKFDELEIKCEVNSAELQGKISYSCDTFNPYLNAKISYEFKCRIEVFLERLGLPYRCTHAFAEFQAGEERQSVRYAWLMFAADVAEEEGL